MESRLVVSCVVRLFLVEGNGSSASARESSWVYCPSSGRIHLSGCLMRGKPSEDWTETVLSAADGTESLLFAEAAESVSRSISHRFPVDGSVEKLRSPAPNTICMASMAASSDAVYFNVLRAKFR